MPPVMEAFLLVAMMEDDKLLADLDLETKIPKNISMSAIPKKYANNGWTNQVKGSVPPKYKKLVAQYAKEKGISKSEVVAQAVQQFFNSSDTCDPASRNRY